MRLYRLEFFHGDAQERTVLVFGRKDRAIGEGKRVLRAFGRDDWRFVPRVERVHTHPRFTPRYLVIAAANDMWFTREKIWEAEV